MQAYGRKTHKFPNLRIGAACAVVEGDPSGISPWNLESLNYHTGLTDVQLFRQTRWVWQTDRRTDMTRHIGYGRAHAYRMPCGDWWWPETGDVFNLHGRSMTSATLEVLQCLASGVVRTTFTDHVQWEQFPTAILGIPRFHQCYPPRSAGDPAGNLADWTVTEARRPYNHPERACCSDARPLHAYFTRRSQHSQECKGPRRHCFCDWPWPLTPK